MLFGETVAVYCENHTEQNQGYWYVEAGGTYSDGWDLKGHVNQLHEDCVVRVYLTLMATSSSSSRMLDTPQGCPNRLQVLISF
jgi:hypothetical protein